MFIWDSHIHSDISFDGKFSIDEFANKARELGLSGITFTEHYDIYDGMNPHDEKAKPFDKEEYKVKLSKAKETFGDYIKAGVEIGLRPDSKNEISEIAGFFDYDFIIGSSHVVCMKNISHDYSFYSGLTKEQAYEKYLKEVSLNIALCHKDFDVYGHLDYAARYGKYDEPEMECSDTLDSVLRLLIENGKGIEVNTASFRLGLGEPHPNRKILKRYKELGGEIITLGSDAHVPEHLAFSFKEAGEILKDTGFKYYAVYSGRKPEFIKL
ncbi:MAG: histidinol-phosphatase HisJ family protein [Clostridia bacterium]|nr:histidinol-phosphatase HisJ family protein [Clostridia bacterium]